MANGDIDARFLDEDGSLLPELRRFNWGAFFLTWIWGICNNTFITLISLAIAFIPVVGLFNIVLCILFGIKGNEWALQNKEWDDIEHFQRVQRAWAKWSVIILFILPVIGVIAALTIPSMMINTNQIEHRTAYKKSFAVLNQAVSLGYALNGKMDMSSSYAFAKDLSQHMSAKSVQGNKVITLDDMSYAVECSDGKSCIITVDINGDKQPNEITKDAKKLKDRAQFKVIKNQKGVCQVLRPKWFKEMEQAKY